MNYIIKPLEGFAESNTLLLPKYKKLFDCILGGGILIIGDVVKFTPSLVLVDYTSGKEIAITSGTYLIYPTDTSLPVLKCWRPLTQGEIVEILDTARKNGSVHLTGSREDRKAQLQALRRRDLEASSKHSHYFKDCPYDKVDVYRILEIFDVTDPCIQHCVKKLLCAGGRGHKDINLDIQNCIDTLLRYQQMREEEKQNVCM